MKMRHTMVASVLVAASMVAAGCSGADSFQSLNDSFKAVKTTSAGLENADLAGAAIATNMAAMELIAAFSTNANGVIAAGGGNVIAAGGGNVIAAGGNNYSVFQTAPTADEGEAELNSDRKDAKGKPVVTAKYAYKRTQGADGSLSYTLKSFDGKASGFTITASGTFDFKPTGAPAVGSEIPATVAAAIKGNISTNGRDVMKLDELSFSVTNPLPENVEKLGVVKISNAADSTAIDLTASIKSKVIGIKGRIKVKGVEKFEVVADESNPNPTVTKLDAK
ncbi:MAG: hypothetical protein ACK46X_12120 [Candidatus Sericytochromatia bacterium]